LKTYKTLEELAADVEGHIRLTQHDARAELDHSAWRPAAQKVKATHLAWYVNQNMDSSECGTWSVVACGPACTMKPDALPPRIGDTPSRFRELVGVAPVETSDAEVPV